MMERTQIVNLEILGKLAERELIGWVVPLNGPLAGRDFRLYAQGTLVGTNADCDVVLTDAHVSGRHCAIGVREGEPVVVDLDSSNGTWLNRVRVAKGHLVSRDKLRVGQTHLAVVLLR